MNKLVLVLFYAFLFACDLPTVENNIEEINGVITMEDFDLNELLDWQVVNDNVMGGRSDATLELTQDIQAEFKGYLSLANNGGFSSIRAYYPPNLTEIKSVKLRIKGDGRNYSFRVRGNTSRWASYSHSFSTIKDEWLIAELKIEDFFPTYRGYNLDDMPSLSDLVIKEIGIMISDKQTGPFKLTIDWIKAE